MTGDKSADNIRPWSVGKVYLFETKSLISKLNENNVKIEVATNVRRQLWEAALVYPVQNNGLLILTAEQKKYLHYFSESA